MNLITYFRKRYDDRFIRRLRKNPVCKYHKGCTCIEDYLKLYDILNEYS
jgi:hypothetical protein